LGRLESRKPPPREFGSAFWTTLVAQEHRTDRVACAEAERVLRFGPAAYRGPRKPLAEIPPGGVIACDREGVHPDGIRVLLKDGSLSLAKRGTDEYARALQETIE